MPIAPSVDKLQATTTTGILVIFTFGIGTLDLINVWCQCE